MTPDQHYAAMLADLIQNGERIRTRNDDVRRLPMHKTALVTFTSTPLICARRTAWKNALREWEWFMSGSSCVYQLHPAVRPWWEPWKDEFGFVRYNYSQQFREFQGDDETIDQIALLIDGVKDHPFSRRNVVSTWHPVEMNKDSCAITNCHGTVIQAFVDTANALHLKTYQRSVDVICGQPHNWLQYYAFLLWLAHRTGRTPGSLTWIGGDVHLYEAHVELAQRIVGVAYAGETPQLVYRPTSEEFKAEDFSLDREYKPVIRDRAEMIV